jgi:lactoylglutathione lyase
MVQFAGYSALVPDVAATVDFYQRAFGLEIGYLHPSGHYAEMKTGEVLLSFTGEKLWEELMIEELPYDRAVPSDPPKGGFIALTFEDIGSALTRAVEAGALKLTDPSRKPWGQTIALIRDLNGHLIELATPPTRRHEP